MTIIFPVLAGQDISFTKKPTFSTIVAPHVSGREVRDALYQNPIWQFEVVVQRARFHRRANIYGGGVGAQSLQALMGLFLQCQGQFGTFLFYDPTDYAVAAQGFGDRRRSDDDVSASTASLGGFAEADRRSLGSARRFAVFPAAGRSRPIAPTNVCTNSVGRSLRGFTASPGDVSLTGSQADPNGGTLAVLHRRERRPTAHYDAAQGSIPIVAGAAVDLLGPISRPAA